MKNHRLKLFAAAALLTIPGLASAHRMWLLPSGTIFSGTDSWVTVDSAVSNDLFYADHQPGRIEWVKVWQPDGTPGHIQNGSTGRYRSVFDVQLDKPGTWKIGSEMSGIMGSFKVDGVEKRVGGRGGPPGPNGVRQPPLTVADIPANATDVTHRDAGPQRDLRHGGRADAHRPETRGQGAGVRSRHPPRRIGRGRDGEVPLPGRRQACAEPEGHDRPRRQRYRDAEGAKEVTTDAQGLLSYAWPAAGMYWVNATLTDDKPTARARPSGG